MTLNDLERRNGVILRYFSEFEIMYDVAVIQSIGLHNDLIECCGAYSEVCVFADDAK